MQGYPLLSLPYSWNEPFLQGILVHFSEERDLETKPSQLSVLVTVGVWLLSGGQTVSDHNVIR